MMKKNILSLIVFFFISLQAAKESDDFAKARDTVALVERAATYIQDDAVLFNDACHLFSKDPTWRKGDIALSILTTDGTILTNPVDTIFIWKNFTKTPDPRYKTVVTLIADRSKKGLGWVDFPVKNRLRSTYIRKIIKNGTPYFITAGFYPLSKKFRAMQLVDTLDEYFKDHGKEAAFSMVSDDLFKRGTLMYLVVYDFEGTCVANGAHPDRVGKNFMDAQDDNGIFYVKKALEVAQSAKESGWIGYNQKNARRVEYVKKIFDVNTQTNYCVVAGYYKGMSPSQATYLVKKAAAYFVENGKEKALKTFADQKGPFVKGAFEIAVFDFKGMCYTTTANTEAGKNYLEAQDDAGIFWFKQLLDKAEQEARGRILSVFKNINQQIYYDEVDTAEGDFLICTIYHPTSNIFLTQELVKNAGQVIKKRGLAPALVLFSQEMGPFFQGNQHIFAYDLEGFCLLNGSNSQLIWHNFSHVVDQEGTPIIPTLIDIAEQDGSGFATFAIANAKRHVYVRRIDIIDEQDEEKSYMIGAGFYE